MRFNTAIQAERNKASAYFNELVDKQVMVEVVKVSPKRSLSQNAYLHLILGAFANHFGYSLEEGKVLYKRDANPVLFVYTKNDIKFLRSSADLTKEEMAISIDNFMKYSAEAGYTLPLATDEAWIMSIQNEMERNKYYVR